MLVRPLDLADRMFGPHQPEVFRLSIVAARRRAREIINESPESGFLSIVEIQNGTAPADEAVIPRRLLAELELHG